MLVRPRAQLGKLLELVECLLDLRSVASAIEGLRNQGPREGIATVSLQFIEKLRNRRLSKQESGCDLMTPNLALLSVEDSGHTVHLDTFAGDTFEAVHDSLVERVQVRGGDVSDIYGEIGERRPRIFSKVNIRAMEDQRRDVEHEYHEAYQSGGSISTNSLISGAVVDPDK